MYYEHPDLMRTNGQQHLEMLIAEAAEERLAAQVEKTNPPLAQFRNDLVRWARPNRRIAIKGI